MAVLVIARFFLRIGENFIGFVDLFETRLRFLIAGIEIRMLLFRHLPVGFFDFLFRRALGDAEHLVIIACVVRHV